MARNNKIKVHADQWLHEIAYLRQLFGSIPKAQPIDYKIISSHLAECQVLCSRIINKLGEVELMQEELADVHQAMSPEEKRDFFCKQLDELGKSVQDFPVEAYTADKNIVRWVDRLDDVTTHIYFLAMDLSFPRPKGFLKRLFL